MYRYGPYLARIPKLSLGDGKGNDNVSPTPAADVGWIYDKVTGYIRGNCGAATDAEGVLFSDY